MKINRISKQNSGIMLHYFKLYTVFILAVLAALVLLQCLYISPKYMKSLRSTAENSFDNLIDNTEDYFSALEETAYYIANSPEISRNPFQSGAQMSESIEHLKNRVVESPILSEIIVYYGSEYPFLSSAGVTSHEYMHGYSSSVSGWEDFYSAIESDESAAYYVMGSDSDEAGRRLAAIYRVCPLNNPDAQMRIICIVPDLNVKSRMKNLYDAQNGQILILKNNDIWINTASDGKISDSELSLADGFYNRRGRLVIVKTAANTGFKYILCYEGNSIMTQYMGFQTVIILFILAFGAIGLFMAFKFSAINYKMIKKICNPLIEAGHEKSAENLYDFEKLISEAVNENKRMSMLLNFQEPFIKRQLLLALLSGKYSDREQLGNICRNIGFNFSGEAFGVCVLSPQDKNEFDEVVYEAVSDYLEKNNLGYAIEPVSDNNIVILLKFASMENAHEIQELIISHIREELKNNFGIEVCTYSGGICADVSDISEAYIRAGMQSSRRTDKLSRQTTAMNETENKNYLLIMEYIRENYSDANLSLKSIADKVDKSIYYVSRIIKSNLGYTFSEYVSGLRLEKAKRLLEETDFTINEITEKIGYLDVASFNKKFKNTVGCTPGTYRKRYAETAEIKAKQ